MANSPKTRKKIYYVVPYALLWGIRKDGIKKVLHFSDSKREAVSLARDMAQKSEAKLIVYAKDYSIAQRISYVKRGRPVSKAK